MVKKAALFLLLLSLLLFAPKTEANLSALDTVWLPKAMLRDKISAVVFNSGGAPDWQARFFVSQADKSSGSVKSGDRFTTGYINLDDLLANNRLQVEIKISSNLELGFGQFKVALKPPAAAKKRAEFTLDTVEVIDSSSFITGSTYPNSPVGLFLNETDADPYLTTVSDAAGHFELGADKAGSIYVLTKTGPEKILLSNSAPKEPEPPAENKQPTDSENVPLQPNFDSLFISALFPDPVSPKTDSKDEWFEISTDSNLEIDLSGFIVSDIFGSISKFVLPSNTKVAKAKPVRFYSRESKITLNNDADGLRLFKPDGSLIFETEVYDRAQPDRAWFLNEKGEWDWEKTEPEIAAKTIPSAASQSEVLTAATNGGETIDISISEVENYVGRRVNLIGVINGKTSTGFYLSQSDNESVKTRIYLPLEIRSFKDKVSSGQVWRVTGLVEIYRGSLRVVPASEADLAMIRDRETAAALKSLKVSKSKTNNSKPQSGKSAANIQPVDKTATAAGSVLGEESQKRPFPYFFTGLSLTVFWTALLKLKQSL